LATEPATSNSQKQISLITIRVVFNDFCTHYPV